MLSQAALLGDYGGDKFCQRKQRQRKSKSTTVRQLALDPNLPAVQPDQFFRNVEPQPQPLAAIIDRIRVLVQPLKNQGFRFRADAAAGIGDGYVDEVGIIFGKVGLNHDRSVGRGKFNGIFQQIGQHLQDTVGVGVNEWNPDINRSLQADCLGSGRTLQHRYRLADDLADEDAVRLDRDLSGLCAGGLQQVGDHGPQLDDAAEHGFQVLTLLGSHPARQAIEDQRDELMNAGQGSPQFVRYVGKEFIL